MALDKMDKIVSLAKRRGFIFQSSEIYGGIGGFWDYGHLGVELKKNVERFWWHHVVKLRKDVVGIDASIVMHPRVWEASGHVEEFHDVMVDCKKCKRRFRRDHVQGEKCPECGGELGEPKKFNLMLRTNVGAMEDSSSVAFLRPETAQAIFADFETVRGSARLKVPFGIAQVGTSFRNEITPRFFTFRSREFEQMEMEYFVHPSDADKWYEYWVNARHQWYIDLGVKPERLRLRPHEKEELAHYAKACTDVEYEFPFGWQELEGIANRTDFDLRRHEEYSGKDLKYFDEATKEKYIPWVIETSAGLTRSVLTVLCDAYDEDVAPTAETEEGKRDEEERVVLRFNPKIAPIQVAVFPLSKKLAEPAQKVEADLRRYFATFYDDAGSIGRRYRRMDEAGTPYCITFDFDSLEDHKVTVRDRDAMTQDRIGFDALRPYLEERLLF